MKKMTMFFNVCMLGCLSASMVAAESTAQQTKAAEVTATQVIRYVPAVPKDLKDGECWTSSIASPGTPYAWRCNIENGIYDPCLTAADGQTIVCGVPDQEVGVKLTQPLPKPEEGATRPARPWLIELPDGVTCALFTGTLPPIEEMAMYGCSDESVLVGELVEGDVWKARKAFLEPTDSKEADALPYRIQKEELAPLLKVWFTGDPKADKE